MNLFFGYILSIFIFLRIICNYYQFKSLYIDYIFFVYDLGFILILYFISSFITIIINHIFLFIYATQLNIIIIIIFIFINSQLIIIMINFIFINQCLLNYIHYIITRTNSIFNFIFVNQCLLNYIHYIITRTLSLINFNFINIQLTVIIINFYFINQYLSNYFYYIITRTHSIFNFIAVIMLLNFLFGLFNIFILKFIYQILLIFIIKNISIQTFLISIIEIIVLFQSFLICIN